MDEHMKGKDSPLNFNVFSLFVMMLLVDEWVPFQSSCARQQLKRQPQHLPPILYNTSNNPYTQQILQWWTSLTPGPHHAGLDGPLNVISMQWCRQPIYLMAISNRHEIGFTSTIYSFESICGPQAGISAYEVKCFQTRICISLMTILNSTLPT